MSSTAASSLPQLLPFSIASYDGGRQAGTTRFEIGNVLDADSEFAHSSQAGHNFNLVLRYAPDKEDGDGETQTDAVCTVTHVVLHGPTDCTSPLKTGVIFTSLQPPALSEYSSAYDDLTQERYDAMPAERLQADGAVAFFTITDTDTLQLAVPLPAWRDCRYVHLKLISGHSENANIDLQRVAIVGYHAGRRPVDETATVIAPQLLGELGLMRRKLGLWNVLCEELLGQTVDVACCLLFLSDPALPQTREAAGLLSAIAESGDYSDDFAFFHHDDDSVAGGGFSQFMAQYMGVGAEAEQSNAESAAAAARPAVALVILDKQSSRSRKYRYSGEMQEAAVRHWLDGFVHGSLTPWFRSARRLPGDVDPLHARVTAVTRASFQELVLDCPKSVLLYAVDRSLPADVLRCWLYSAADVIVHSQLLFACLDSDDNDLPEQLPLEFRTTPGAIFFPARAKHSPVVMELEETCAASSFLSFLNRHAPELQLDVAELSSAPKMQAAEMSAGLLMACFTLPAAIKSITHSLPDTMREQAAQEMWAAARTLHVALTALRMKAERTGWRDVQEEEKEMVLELQVTRAAMEPWRLLLQDIRAAHMCGRNVTEHLRGAVDAITDAEFRALTAALSFALLALPREEEDMEEATAEEAKAAERPAGGSSNTAAPQPDRQRGDGDAAAASSAAESAEAATRRRESEEEARQLAEARKAAFSRERLSSTQQRLQLAFEPVRERLAARQAELAAAHDGRVVRCHSAAEVQAALDAASAASQLTVIDFTATWCGPCKRVAPVYGRLSQQHAAVQFLKVDVDECEDFCQQWEVTAIPSFAFIRGGQELPGSRITGADVDALIRRLEMETMPVEMAQAA